MAAIVKAILADGELKLTVTGSAEYGFEHRRTASFSIDEGISAKTTKAVKEALEAVLAEVGEKAEKHAAIAAAEALTVAFRLKEEL